MGRHSSPSTAFGTNLAIGAMAIALTGVGVGAITQIENPVRAIATGASASASPAGDVRVTAAGVPDGGYTPTTPAPTGPACASGRSVAVTTTPDMAPALRRIANAAEQRAGSACVRYAIAEAPAGVTVDKILVSNAKTPDIWVPDSTVWVDEIAQQAKLDVRFGDVVASSPVGLAMPKVLLDQGARTGRHTWKELVTGPHLVMGASDPEYSTASMLTLLSASQAAQADPRATAGLQASLVKIARNVRDDNELMTRAADGTTTATAFPASEQQMATERAQAGNAPVSGLTVSDPRLTFQYGVVPFPAGGDVARSAADALRAEMTSAEGRQILRDYGFRAPGGSIVPVPGMDIAPDEFAGTPLTISNAEFEHVQTTWNSVTSTMRALIAIDVSGSMKQRMPGTGITRIQLASTATQQAAKALSGKAVVGLWAFSTNIGANGAPFKEIVPMGELEGASAGGGFRDQRSKLLDVGSRLPSMIGGGTALYDTISAAVKQAQAGFDPQRSNAVVVWTDGVDRDGGTMSEAQLLGQLRDVARSDKPVRVLLVGMGADSDIKVLRDIASASGGAAFSAKNVDTLSSVLQTLLTGRVEEAGTSD